MIMMIALLAMGKIHLAVGWLRVCFLPKFPPKQAESAVKLIGADSGMIMMLMTMMMVMSMVIVTIKRMRIS